MAEILGTSGPDVYELKTQDTYRAGEGDDVITVTGRWGAVDPGAGNDTVTIDPAITYAHTLFYWNSPGAITVDLQEGYALDGYGTRDRLINVHNVHGFQKAGDKGLGSSLNDLFFVIPRQGVRSGLIELDGRDGQDTVVIRVDNASSRGELVIRASADGRAVRAWLGNEPGFVIQMRNVEFVELRLNGGKEVVSPLSLIDFSTSGQDILLRGASGWQTTGAGKPLTITYSFLTERPAEGAEGGSGFTAFNAAQQQVVRDLFARLQQQTGAEFREVAGSGDIRLGINQQTDTRGYAFVPDFHRGQAKAGDVWLDVETAAVMNPGQEGYYTLLHEIGHALGLQHPLEASDTSGAVVLLKDFASLSNTVMLERSAADTGGMWPSWFGSMDLQALRYLYGGRSVAQSADRYTVADVLRTGTLTVIDDGGDDTLDASGSTAGVTLDLRQGYTSSIGAGADGVALRGNVALAVGTVIEHAVGSPLDDFITGNEVGNRLQGNGGSDLIDGRGGLDWAVFKGARTGWSVETGLSGANRFVTALNGTGGMSELRSIERVRFDDAVVAYDLGRTDHTGKALLLLGAVIGRAATLSKAPLVGAVVDFLDQGVSLEALAGAIMRLPIWGGVLTPTNSSEDIARHLLKVTTGVEPSAADVAAGARAIAGQPQGAYLAGLALGDANVAQVGLTGLAASGFEYPVG